MKKLSIITLFVFTSLSIFAQANFSKTYNPDEFISDRINVFSLDGNSYVLNEEFCQGFGQEGCVEIYRVDEDGDFDHVKSVGRYKIFTNTTSVKDDILTFVGSNNNNTLTLFSYDALLNELRSKEIMTASNVWIWSLIEYNDFVVVAVREFILENGLNQLIFIRKSDFEIVHVKVPELLIEAGLTTPFIDDEGLLVYIVQNQDGKVEVRYNENLEEEDYTIIYDSEEHIPNLNFVTLSSGRKVFGLDERKFLLILNNENEVAHKINIDDVFDEGKLYAYDMIEASNGDILICGSISNASLEGFIVRINQDGEVLWNRIYSPTGNHKALLSSIVELPDQNILFYGSARLTSPSSNSFYNNYWIIKTDENGCIDEDCEGLASSTPELSNLEFKVYPNPTSSFINIEISGNLEYKVNLYDVSHRLILSEINVTKLDVSTFTQGLYLLEISDLNSGQSTTKKIVVYR